MTNFCFVCCIRIKKTIRLSGKLISVKLHIGRSFYNEWSTSFLRFSQLFDFFQFSPETNFVRSAFEDNSPSGQTFFKSRQTVRTCEMLVMIENSVSIKNFSAGAERP